MADKIYTCITITFSIFVEAICYPNFFFIKYLFKYFALILICLFVFLWLIFQNALNIPSISSWQICCLLTFSPRIQLVFLSSLSCFSKSKIFHFFPLLSVVYCAFGVSFILLQRQNNGFKKCSCPNSWNVLIQYLKW